MYNSFYQLDKDPFSITPDPGFFFHSLSHQSALNQLIYGISCRKGFMVVTGEVGTGKTTLCRELLRRLDKKTKTAYIFNPGLSGEELIRSILGDLGIPVGHASKKELIDFLNDYLLFLSRMGGNLVVIVDEAQGLRPEVLEDLRLLSNLETDKIKLLQIALIGQPELLSMLYSHNFRQLCQRVNIWIELKPLSRKETGRYIGHRLTVAGSRGNVQFSSAALSIIYSASQGIPRKVNLLCERSMIGGYAAYKRQINGELVRLARSELRMSQAACSGIFRRWMSR